MQKTGKDNGRDYKTCKEMAEADDGNLWMSSKE